MNKKFDSLILEVTGGNIDMGVIERVKKFEREEGLQKGRIELEKERARAEAEKRAKERSIEVADLSLVADVRKELTKK